MIGNFLRIIITLFVGYFLGIVFGMTLGILLGGIPSLFFREIVDSYQTVLMSITVTIILGVLLGLFAMQLANKSFSANDKPIIGILLGLTVAVIILFIFDGVIDILDPDMVNRPMYIIPIIYSGRIGSYIGGTIFPIIGIARVILDMLASYRELRRNKSHLEGFQKFLISDSSGENNRNQEVG